jgi:lipoprotein-releasing system ATP-binding protein
MPLIQMKIVISPAKSLNFESDLPTQNFSEASFLKESRQINKVLKKLKPKDLSVMMDISDKLAELRNEKIGFVFQFHYLLAEFSCLKNVMIPALRLGNYSREEIEETAFNKLKILGLEDQALKPASKLSGGQQQRVAIARALINDPKIIMGDEPTGNLDSKNTQIVFDIFKQLTQEFGQTIVAVTHDNDFAKASDRTIEMADGFIV